MPHSSLKPASKHSLKVPRSTSNTMMLSTHSRPAFAASGRRSSNSSRRPALVVQAQHNSSTTTSTTTTSTAAQRYASAVLSAAVAAFIVLAAPVPVLAAPQAETKTFGAERTERLIKEAGTPEAARPDTMKTNVPFQAPGINKPPRGRGQEQGTSPKQVVKNIKKTIKEQNADPDSTPLGISKGPLVKSAKKMDQPGRLKNINREGAFKFKTLPPPEGIKGTDVEKPVDHSKKGIINGSFTTIFGGRNQ